MFNNNLDYFRVEFRLIKKQDRNLALLMHFIEWLNQSLIAVGIFYSPLGIRLLYQDSCHFLLDQELLLN